MTRGASSHLRQLIRRPAVLAALPAVVLGAVLRLVNLTARLPQQLEPDEWSVVQRGGLVLSGQLRPGSWDWPPLVTYVWAGVQRVVGVAHGLVLEPGLAQQVTGRVAFAGIALLVVVATAWLADTVVDAADDVSTSTRVVAVGTAGLAMAVSYLSVRLGRRPHPDHLQTLLMVLSVGASLRYVRRPRVWLLVTAGLLAGLAGAAKYVGVITLASVAVAGLSATSVSVQRRLAVTAGAGIAAGIGYVIGTLGYAITQMDAMLAGLERQALQQQAGRLGFEALEPGWWYHLTTTLPGNWGWPLTVLAVVGTVMLVVRVGLPGLVLVLPIGIVFLGATLTGTVFPHYVLPALPFLAVAAGFAASAIVQFAASRIPERAPLAAAAVAIAVVAALAPTVANDVRYVRAIVAPDTRELAARWLEEHAADDPRPVVAEAYTTPGAPGTRVTSLARHHVGAIDCGCLVVISSTMEQRFRRLPRYAEQAAVYDRFRERGRVVAEFVPSYDLSYRWDQLPGFGIEQLPLFDEVGLVGPRVTVLDLGPHPTDDEPQPEPQQ